MVEFSRRDFIQRAQAVGLAYTALALTGCQQGGSANKGTALIADPNGIVDLPAGFSYKIVSETGGEMSDGFLRPGRPDGMACYEIPGEPDKCILLRNHENWPDTDDGSPFGEDDELLPRLPEGKLYDVKPDGRPFTGGVTKVIYDLKKGELESDHLSLVGTTGNCAGGRTPWGSWLSCEESAVGTNDGAGQQHGFVFEVPAASEGLVDPVPLKAMGRFTHEAAAIDPDTGIVYMTEDNRNGLFYRFIPNVRGQMDKGGQLQALAIIGWPSAETSNWPRDWVGDNHRDVLAGHEFKVEWIDLDDVEAPDNDLAERGHQKGAARFLRGEGMDYGLQPGSSVGEIFFTCTQGGAARAGQVWRFIPSKGEGGALTLLYESPSSDVLDMCDNLVIAPWGDLILCEDGFGNQFLRGLTPEGAIYDLARNAHEDKSEFCGACFSPDGQVLFVNIQSPGITLAIVGPWDALRAG